MSRKAAYNFGSVAYKYDSLDFDYEEGLGDGTYGAQASPARKGKPKRQLGVVPGGAHGRDQERSTEHALAAKVAKATVAAVVVFAAIGFGRITLSAATVAEALEAREITTNLEIVRSNISDLEVQQSSLSNPTRIKTEAAELGMAAPATSTVIDISGDVVVTDEDGNLSLTGSIASLSAQGSETLG